MDSAKDIAREMLAAVNVDGSGFLGAMAKGFISFPVSLGYLGYDFIDTDHHRENEDDKFRIARLIKKGTFRRELIERAVSIFLDDFVSRVDIDKIAKIVKNAAGTATGKMIFAQVSGGNLGTALTSGAVSSFFAGTMLGSLLYIGAETSRAIYTSRTLQVRNPDIYYRLRNAGDLDLLYFFWSRIR